MARIIKEHANRRLYDAEQKRAITLNNLAQLIKSERPLNPERD